MDDKLRGMDDKLRGMDDKLRGMDDKLRGMDDKLRGMDDKLRGMDDKLRGMDDKLRGMDDKLVKLKGAEGALDCMDDKLECMNDKLECMDDKLDSMDDKLVYLKGADGTLEHMDDKLRGMDDKLVQLKGADGTLEHLKSIANRLECVEGTLQGMDDMLESMHGQLGKLEGTEGKLQSMEGSLEEVRHLAQQAVSTSITQAQLAVTQNLHTAIQLCRDKRHSNGDLKYEKENGWQYNSCESVVVPLLTNLLAQGRVTTPLPIPDGYIGKRNNAGRLAFRDALSKQVHMLTGMKPRINGRNGYPAGNNGYPAELTLSLVYEIMDCPPQAGYRVVKSADHIGDDLQCYEAADPKQAAVQCTLIPTCLSFSMDFKARRSCTKSVSSLTTFHAEGCFLKSENMEPGTSLLPLCCHISSFLLEAHTYPRSNTSDVRCLPGLPPLVFKVFAR